MVAIFYINFELRLRTISKGIWIYATQISLPRKRGAFAPQQADIDRSMIGTEVQFYNLKPIIVSMLCLNCPISESVSMRIGWICRRDEWNRDKDGSMRIILFTTLNTEAYGFGLRLGYPP
mgnify:CR=1 FL=1